MSDTLLPGWSGRVGALALAALCVFAGGNPATQAQSPSRRAPTFPSAVELVRLSISVTDGANRYVPGLEKGTFAVFEDDVRQETAHFTNDPLPLSVSILLDCSASMEESLRVAQAAALRFTRTLGPDDLAQVVAFDDRVVVLQDFTTDQAQIGAAIGRARASGTTALFSALYVTLKELTSHGTAEKPRRRAIVLLSDGENTSSLVSDEQVLEQARICGVGVYAIALRPPDNAPRGDGIASGVARHFLTAVARETGGQVFPVSSLSDLGAAYDLVAEELRTQYTLAYVSSNPLRDGKWRRVVVRTPGREDLRVRYRTGYRAPAR